VMSDVIVGMAHGPAQPLELQRPQLIGARPLDRVERLRSDRCHLLPPHASRPIVECAPAYREIPGRADGREEADVELRYRFVNGFTRPGEPLSGNPLCVFEDGRGLDTATMQALARQFNLSETTFILASETADARVRIFTPSYEMQFAGHPTLGTAHVCRALGLGGESL